MKKKILAAILISGLTMTTVASANWNGPRGNNDCSMMHMRMQAFQNLDEATQAEVKQFYADNQALLKEIAMKRAEKRALMRSDNPDPKAAAKVTGEMFDLRTTLQLKADEAGVAQYIGPMGMGFGKMNGRGGHGGYGRHHGQKVN